MRDTSLPKSTLQYRADIDGLRAVAVLSVVAFHFGIFHLTGGFVGVDVFFVVSGYLISSIVFSEIAGSRFSVSGFYQRRIRRIFPALFAMVLAYAAFAAIFFLPTELIEFSKQTAAAAFSVSNFYFWAHVGYFDTQNQNPLLHTWSLAVEEQFYVLFPIFLVIVRKFFATRLRASVVLLFVISLIASIVTVRHSPDTAFYMPYTRAWELLLGTLLSLGMFPKLQSIWLRNISSIAGVGMIAYADFIFNSGTLFPGLNAMLPCLGAALIIGAGESGSSAVYSVLAWRPVVFVGLVSYSFYLWHWPVLMIYKMGLVDWNAQYARHQSNLLTVGRFEHLVVFALAFALAVLSWRFVEQPFRNGRLKLTGTPLFAFAATMLLACAGFTMLILSTDGLRGRFSPQAIRIASYLGRGEALQDTQRSMRLGTCFLDQNKTNDISVLYPCLSEDSNRANYLLIGDSHAAALWQALSQSLPAVNVMQATVGGCEPNVHQVTTGACSKVMDYVFETYLPHHAVQALILEANWLPTSIAPLEQTLAWAKDHKVPVIVLGCVPTYDAPLARLLAYSVNWNKPGLAMDHLVPSVGVLDHQMRAVVQDKWHVPFVSLYDAICQGGECVQYADTDHNVPLMNDGDHLNPPGSLLVVRHLIASGELPASR